MKKLELDEQDRKKHDAELNNKRVQNYMKTIDKTTVLLPQGTKARIEALGYSTNAFIKELVLKELDKLEGK